MQITTIGLDIAKNVFQVHGIDAAEKVIVRKQLRRGQIIAFFEALAPCLVGMEACATSHHWARELTKLGHEVRLMPAKDVKPPSAFQRSRSRQRPRINGITCSRLVITIGLSVDPTTEDDRCHYDAATAPRPRKTVADPIGIGVRVGGPYLPLDYCVGAACLAEISASAG